MIKNPSANAGDMRHETQGLIPGLGRYPGEGHGNPLQNSCPEKPTGQRSLAGYSPQGCKESDTTEATAHTHTDALNERMVSVMLFYANEFVFCRRFSNFDWVIAGIHIDSHKFPCKLNSTQNIFVGLVPGLNFWGLLAVRKGKLRYRSTISYPSPVGVKCVLESRI